jgi:hypothetical protein
VADENAQLPEDEDLELDAEQADDVKGGAKPLAGVVKLPPPGGPVPIPYPNTN